MINYERRTIVETEEIIRKGDLSLDELLDITEEFACSVPEELAINIHIGWGAGFILRATRLENEEEFDTRISEAKARAFKYQAGADRSWEKQKRKFRNAKKRRKVKTDG